MTTNSFHGHDSGQLGEMAPETFTIHTHLLFPR